LQKKFGFIPKNIQDYLVGAGWSFFFLYQLIYYLCNSSGQQPYLVLGNKTLAPVGVFALKKLFFFGSVVILIIFANVKQEK
jgi:hypothetical protein